MSTSSATGIVVAEIHAESEQSPSSSTTSRQPSATAAAARLPPEGPSPELQSAYRIEHANSDKKSFVSIRFDSRYRIDFFDSIRQSDKFAACTLIFK